MKILGVDTSSSYLCIGVYDNDSIYEYNLELNRKHSALLMVSIRRILDALNRQIKDIDYFACGVGPGSFTGVRIAVATIKGLAGSLHKPVLGIPTLDIIAKNVTADGVIIPIVDAKRNLIYCSTYINSKGLLKRISPYMLISIDELLKKIQMKSMLLGDAAGLYKEKILNSRKTVTILDKDYWYPRSGNIITLSLEHIKDKKIYNAFTVKPVYLYPKECQIKV